MQFFFLVLLKFQSLREKIIYTAYDRIFIIDGKRITMENFNTMFEAWEGWHFEFEILDPYDERT